MDDHGSRAQDVVRCDLCQITEIPMYCDVCHIHLCRDCVEKHLTDSSNVHKVVSFKQYCTTLNYPKCRKHPSKLCELHCEKCNIPICAHCITGDHQVIDQQTFSKTLTTEKKIYGEICRNQKNISILDTKKLQQTSQLRKLI